MVDTRPRLRTNHATREYHKWECYLSCEKRPHISIASAAIPSRQCLEGVRAPLNASEDQSKGKARRKICPKSLKQKDSGCAVVAMVFRCSLELESSQNGTRWREWGNQGKIPEVEGTP